jgi:hypothetical protein
MVEFIVQVNTRRLSTIFWSAGDHPVTIFNMDKQDKFPASLLFGDAHDNIAKCLKVDSIGADNEIA